MQTNNNKFELVIHEYKSGQFKQSELARRHGVCGATVSVWIRKSGCSRGSRGRPAFEEPTSRQRAMLGQAWTDTYDVVAARFGVSKQYINKLAQRWKIWAERQLGPRCIKEEPSCKRVKTSKTAPHTLSPNVISFRVSDSVLAKILLLRGNKDQFRDRSLHFVARELLLAGIGQGQRSVAPVGELIQAEFVCTAN